MLLCRIGMFLARLETLKKTLSRRLWTACLGPTPACQQESHVQCNTRRKSLCDSLSNTLKHTDTDTDSNEIQIQIQIQVQIEVQIQI